MAKDEFKIPPAPKTKEESLEKYIAAAENFDELFALLDKTSGIQGSKEFFESAKLKEIIWKAREGGLSTEYVTRASGLRERVEDLLQAEKIKKAVDGKEKNQEEKK